ncbi:hypothetical protein EAI_02128 [Harpegnathos saltator]|uniref:Uncharacterized protein n=1 Tax=Harpegnathos saltator TaxID=610380 RepID=E2BAC8_HARSA|nr:hypothetical protein EAI_02128 [Harpegnathos saltator]
MERKQMEEGSEVQDGKRVEGGRYWEEEEKRRCRMCGGEEETWEHIWEECMRVVIAIWPNGQIRPCFVVEEKDPTPLTLHAGVPAVREAGSYPRFEGGSVPEGIARRWSGSPKGRATPGSAHRGSLGPPIGWRRGPEPLGRIPRSGPGSGPPGVSPGNGDHIIPKVIPWAACVVLAAVEERSRRRLGAPETGPAPSNGGWGGSKRLEPRPEDAFPSANGIDRLPEGTRGHRQVMSLTVLACPLGRAARSASREVPISAKMRADEALEIPEEIIYSQQVSREWDASIEAHMDDWGGDRILNTIQKRQLQNHLQGLDQERLTRLVDQPDPDQTGGRAGGRRLPSLKALHPSAPAADRDGLLSIRSRKGIPLSEALHAGAPAAEEGRTSLPSPSSVPATARRREVPTPRSAHREGLEPLTVPGEWRGAPGRSEVFRGRVGVS